MMGKFVDLTGKVFGRLTVVECVKGRYPSGRSWIKWKCVCTCQGEALVTTQNLLGGHTKSCGCLNKEIVSLAKTKHGLRDLPEYSSWANMKSRCDNQNTENYRYYGGRGIKYQDSWKDFAEFYADMGDRPPNTSLDRIDTNGDYCKENCRWSVLTEQAFNTNISSANTSGCPGVSWHTRDLVWCAWIRSEGVVKSVGRYKNFEDAVKARHAAEIDVYGHLKI